MIYYASGHCLNYKVTGAFVTAETVEYICFGE
jgi:hypothetical protein